MRHRAAARFPRRASALSRVSRRDRIGQLSRVIVTPLCLSPHPSHAYASPSAPWRETSWRVCRAWSDEGGATSVDALAHASRLCLSPTVCSRYRTCLSTWLCHTPRGQVHPLVHAQGLWSPPMSPPPHGHRSFPGAANTFSFAARVAQSIGTIRKAASPSGNKSQKREQNREAEREQCGWKRSKENRNDLTVLTTSRTHRAGANELVIRGLPPFWCLSAQRKRNA